ncbi:hypothetical protein [Spongiactinospora sp. TRM90649]|uniref:hypothetical protein n=1 Tax=Spongiactinospora sp. TRM90649 TaxID=3031114 RepID=UPI0023F647FA|nr:hypothetical protein [Spongiactinospora sp. TRM90649]MDF5754595.1 hypothetical protein [Spongiactinospora sp. TRM90649]
MSDLGPLFAPRGIAVVGAHAAFDAIGAAVAVKLLDADVLHKTEIEVNPLRLTPRGLVALDAVILTRKADDAHPDQ